MSVSSNGDRFDPAHRPQDDKRSTSKASYLVSKSGMEINDKIKSNTTSKANLTSQTMPINGELGSSSSSASGSLDEQNASNKASSMHASLYHSPNDPNISLDVINPILDLVDEDDDAFSLPLSQQDEKLLEELLR